MSGSTSINNQRFFSYDGIKNKTLYFHKPVARVIIRDSYNIAINLSKIPIIGIFIYDCHNVTVNVESGGNSSLECNLSDKVQFTTDDKVHDLSISEYRSSNVFFNGYRLDGAWISSEWKME